ncbi:hypothetical protein HDF18_16880 [Mucilaginibacter sp. X5P1]|uniref:hypothetical protein n=1 Tax=Mucilaginibacter sp. X5P1 TaxID=2723088 RepID=UPI00161F674B|nr:hypothetical protein [Mucilaginibacter sp. X5P1]MBB6139307.1 hypothetical protein [Mucilaginibacter sp. X5P1]
MKNFKNLLDDNDALDINNTYPGIVVRKGMGLLFVFFVLLLGIMAFIPYPQKVNIETTINPVIKKFIYDIDTSTFKVSSFYKKNSQPVSLNEKVVILVNRATGEKKEISAPFAGQFFYTGNINGKSTFYILSLNTDIHEIDAEINTETAKAIKRSQKVQIKILNNDTPLRGYVSLVTLIPLTNKSNVAIIINSDDHVKLRNILKDDLIQPMKADIDIFINNQSVLNKAFGVLGDNLSLHKN